MAEEPPEVLKALHDKQTVSEIVLREHSDRRTDRNDNDSKQKRLRDASKKGGTESVVRIPLFESVYQQVQRICIVVKRGFVESRERHGDSGQLRFAPHFRPPETNWSPVCAV